MAKWSFLPWRQSSANKFRPDSLNYGCISVSKSGEVSAGDYNNKAVPVMPTGSIIPFAGKTAPEGWLFCQGQAVSRTTYAQLFAVIGTTYGSGDGSTTFNVPDLRGRVAVGAEASDANLGAAIGEKKHCLSVAELPTHSHGYNAYQFSAKAENGALQSTGPIGVRWGEASTTSYTGSSIEHNIMQPSLLLNQIIKA